ncbi:MAG: hypothetical protein QOJ16_2329, partial [Acidobacteriota bacterium]|nr:hypothetical protein [Acidobacteriota bacterium]
MALAAPPSPFEYHIAISYAREDEAYVARVAEVLRQNDALVFFDRSQDFLGTHLGIELFDVFLNKACYCLVFVSRHYAEKKYTQYEFSIILSRYIQDPGVLLPVRFDPTPLKGLDPGLYFDDLTQGTPPESLAKKILSKLTSVFPPEGGSRSYLDLEIPFVGRRSEIEGIEKLLGRESVKILVLYGQGGTGKTRLAWEVAKRLRGSFKDDMVFVELEPFRMAARVPAEIARCVGAREVEGVAIEKSLTEYLKPKHLLLVLDKFEHLSSAGRYLGELANQCPGLKILVTSRWALSDLGDMHSFPIPPLSLPPAGKKVTKKLARKSDAIELFRARAFQKRPDLDLDKYLHQVAQICWKLEGLAQAILLAASQLRRHEPAEILELLDLYFGGKPGGLNELEKAMHVSIGWSYDLLPSTEQALLRRLAIFSESFTPEAAYEVCGEGLSGDLREALELLSDRSLLQKEHGTTAAGVRFRMAEVIREYALERLREREGEAAFRRRHAQEYARLVQDADRGLKTGERERWLNLLDLERANFQSALEWCFSDHGDRELGSRLAGNLFWFWNFRAEFSEGRIWLEQALGDLSESRAKALYAAGGLAFLQGEYDQARSLLTASVRIWRKLPPERERDLGYALIILGMAALGQGDMDAALAAE